MKFENAFNINKSCVLKRKIEGRFVSPREIVCTEREMDRKLGNYLIKLPRDNPGKLQHISLETEAIMDAGNKIIELRLTSYDMLIDIE